MFKLQHSSITLRAVFLVPHHDKQRDEGERTQHRYNTAEEVDHMRWDGVQNRVPTSYTLHDFPVVHENCIQIFKID